MYRSHLGEGCYVDNEPHAVTSGAELVDDLDGVAYVEGDLRDHALLDHPGFAGLIDWDRPVGLLLVGVLYFVEDRDDPWAATAAHVDRLTTGSCVAISHYTLDGWRAPDTEEIVREYQRQQNPLVERSRSDVDRFLTGLEAVPPHPGAEPELTYVGLWGAEDPEAADDLPRLSRVVYDNNCYHTLVGRSWKAAERIIR